MVLSIGPAVLAKLPPLQPGAAIQLVTESVPDLSGVRMAIGGGPSLVENGKAMNWPGFLHMRHPRSACGWNKDYFFMVEVDGRQSNLSVGMTFGELANYLVKLGCTEAINFDGGGSATLWALGAVRNSPSEGDERPSANALVLVKKKSAPGVH
jgi:exopolysaccharide biosynthesis protein